MALIKCSECKKEVSDKAAACPSCGCPVELSSVPAVNNVAEPVKKVSRDKKLRIFIEILVLIILAMIYYGFYGGKDDLHNLLNRVSISSPNATPIFQLPSTISQTPPPATPHFPPPMIKKIGDSFVLWGFEYTVEKATNEGSNFAYQKSDGKYILIKIKTKNVGKTEQGVSKIVIKDSMGRQYDWNPLIMDFSSGLNQFYGRSSDYNGIRPGLSETFGPVFEVAKDSAGLTLEFPSAQGPSAAIVQLGI